MIRQQRCSGVYNGCRLYIIRIAAAAPITTSRLSITTSRWPLLPLAKLSLPLSKPLLPFAVPLLSFAALLAHCFLHHIDPKSHEQLIFCIPVRPIAIILLYTYAADYGSPRFAHTRATSLFTPRSPSSQSIHTSPLRSCPSDAENSLRDGPEDKRPRRPSHRDRWHCVLGQKIGFQCHYNC